MESSIPVYDGNESTTPYQEPIPVISDQPLAAPLAPAVADHRADKYSFSVDKTFDEFRPSILNGEEGALRGKTAAEQGEFYHNQFQDLVLKTSQRKEGPLTSNELGYLQDAFQRNKDFSNPSSVFEASLTKKYFDNIYKSSASMDSWYNDYFKAYPQQEQVTTDIGKSYLTKQQWLLNKREDLQAAAENQSYLGWGADLAKDLVTFGLYGQAKERGNFGTSFFSGLTGTNVREQRRALFGMPLEAFQKTAGELLDKLSKDNPSKAVEFIDKLLGHSDEDLDNLWSAATFLTVPGVGTAAKLGAKTVVKGIARGALSTEPPKVAVNAAVGNLEEAAVQKATDNAVKSFQGRMNPVQEIVADLPAVINMQREIAGTNPGTFRELTTRIQESYNSLSTNLMKLLSTSQKVEYMPGPLRLEAAVRAIKDWVKDNKYPGLSNHVLEIGDPMWESVSNTHWVETKLGNKGAIYWGEEAEARAFAKLHGIVLAEPVDDAKATRLKFAMGQTRRKIEDLESPPVIGYKTEKGSTTLADSKAERIVYLTEEQANALKQPGARYFLHDDGTVSVINKTEKGGWKRSPTADHIPFSTMPEVGKVPLELSQASGLGFKESAFGDKITELAFKQSKENVQALKDQLTKHTEEFAGLERHKGAHIKDDGLGVYISNWTPLSNELPIIRQNLFVTKESKTPDSLAKAFTSWFRTPEESFSHDARMNAKIASYGPNNLLALAKNELKTIQKLTRFAFSGTTRKMRADQFEGMLNTFPTMRDPQTGELGYIFKTAGEMEDFYLRSYGRSPVNAEVESFFAYKRFVELEGALRDLREYTTDIRQGAELHRITTFDESGKKVYSPFIKGQSIGTLPRDGTIMVMGDAYGKERLSHWLTLPKKLRTELEAGIKSGEYKIVKVLDVNDRPLLNFGKAEDNRINYVVHKSSHVETKPLTIQRSASKPFDYDHEFAIKQAYVKLDKISKENVYEKDIHVLGISNRAMGRDVLAKLEKVRILIRDGKLAEAEQASKELPISYEEQRAWYANKLDKNTPLQLVPMRAMVGDVDKTLEHRYPKFKDATQSRYLNEKRDPYELFSIVDKGSKGNPLYHYEPAKVISAIPTMNRAMNRIVNSSYMDDYKIFSQEHWVREAMNHLDVPLSAVQNSPGWVFYNGKLKPNTPLEIRSRLEANRMKIQQILGTPNTIDSFLHSVANHMSDGIYNKLGPTSLDPSWMIPKLTDVGRILRSATYHTTIGLFALPQFLVQNMTYVTIAGISGPIKASQGTLGAFFHQLTRLSQDPGFIDKLDGIASKMGWKPGQFKEAQQAMLDTGFQSIGREHILIDTPYQSKAIKSGLESALDLGTIVFKEGERNARFGAWYTAYKEFRDLNPTGVLSNYEKGQIFERAELLSGNMSNASKSMLQRGPMSFPTQFLSYNMRLAELMTGSRLTMVEKTRLFGTYASVFGVSALGLWGYPFGDSVKQAAMEHGYIPGDSEFATTLMEGLPAAMLYMITGNRYNVGQRLGSPGLDVLRDIWSSDKTIWNLMGGASWNFLSNVWDSTDGLRAAGLSFLREDQKHFPMKMDDFIEPLTRTVNSLSIAARTYAAANTMNWLGKKGQLLDTDISPLNAAFMGVTGLQPLAVSDSRQMILADHEKKDMMKTAEQHFMHEFSKFAQAMKDNDPQQATDYFKRGIAQLVINGYPYEKYSALLARAVQSNQSLVNRTNFDFYLKDISPDKKQMMNDAFIRSQQLKLQGKQ